MGNGDARSVSHEGSKIAFVRGEPLNQEIWVMSADGERSAKVVGEQGDVFGAVAWSRDGRRFAFVRYTFKSGYHWGSVSLWISRPDSGMPNIILSGFILRDELASARPGPLVSCHPH